MTDQPQNLPDVPAADDLTAPWWDATRDHRLTVQRCGTCEAVQHPPRAVCLACSTLGGLTQVEASGTGEVDWQPWPIPKPRDGLRVVLTPLGSA